MYVVNMLTKEEGLGGKNTQNLVNVVYECPLTKHIIFINPRGVLKSFKLGLIFTPILVIMYLVDD